MNIFLSGHKNTLRNLTSLQGKSSNILRTGSVFQIFENLYKIVPYSFCGSNAENLLGCMDILHIRSKGYTVQSFHFFIEKPAFEACVDRYDFRLMSVHFLKNCNHFIS